MIVISNLSLSVLLRERAALLTVPATIPHQSIGICNLRNILRVNWRNLIKLGMWNACSVNNKIASLAEIVISNSLDVFVITETWLRQGKEHTLCMLNNLPGYQLTSLPRASRGGGLAVLSRKGICSKVESRCFI